jgi:hypothetical protein
VLGNYSASSNIFRLVANALNTLGTNLGVTDPSSTEQRIFLDVLIVIGHKGQTEATRVVTKNEFVSFRRVCSGVIVLGASDTYYSSFISGEALEYYTATPGTENWDTVFPPISVSNGSKIEVTGRGPRGGIYSEAYSYVYLFDSYVTNNSLVAYGPALVMDGRLKIVKSYLYKLAYFGARYNCLMKLSELYIADAYSDNIGYSVFFAVAPVYMKNCISINPYAAHSYAQFTSGETIITKTMFINSSGDVSTGSLAFAVGAKATYHYLDCRCPNSNTIGTGYAAAGTFLETLIEKSFIVNTIDYLGNPIAGVNIEIISSTGYSAGYLGITTIKTMLATDADTTISLVDNSSLSPNDYILIGGEVMKVNTVDGGGEDITVDRAQEGTYACSYGAGINVYKKTIPQTAASGIVMLSDYGAFKYHPVIFECSSIEGGSAVRQYTRNNFTLKAYKEGYETYTIKKIVCSRTELADLAAKTFTIKLRNTPTPGRDEMGPEIN